MIFVLFFFIINIFSMDQNSDLLLKQSASTPQEVIFVEKVNITNYAEMAQRYTAQYPHKSMYISIDGTQDNLSYKDRIKTLNELLVINQKTIDQNSPNAHLVTLHNQMNTYKREYLDKIVTQTHAIALVSSLGILLLKKYCHKNAAFLLVGSLTIPYFYNYEYLKEKNQNSFENAIPDFGVFAFLAFILFGVDRFLSWL